MKWVALYCALVSIHAQVNQEVTGEHVTNTPSPDKKLDVSAYKPVDIFTGEKFEEYKKQQENVTQALLDKIAKLGNELKVVAEAANNRSRLLVWFNCWTEADQFGPTMLPCDEGSPRGYPSASVMNPETGLFTAPVEGYYSFSVNLDSYDGDWIISFPIFSNRGDKISSLTRHSNESASSHSARYQSRAQTYYYYLEAGSSTGIYLEDGRINSYAFSGYLLHAGVN